VKCEAYDDVQVNCSLPGVPELTMSFANTAIINDVTFHPCVRFRPWDSNQILSFVPPDGQFKLMSYRYSFVR
jgi:AP-3 complex subunit mu